MINLSATFHFIAEINFTTVFLVDLFCHWFRKLHICFDSVIPGTETISNMIGSLWISHDLHPPNLFLAYFNACEIVEDALEEYRSRQRKLSECFSHCWKGGSNRWNEKKPYQDSKITPDESIFGLWLKLPIRQSGRQRSYFTSSLQRSLEVIKDW